MNCRKKKNYYKKKNCRAGGGGVNAPSNSALNSQKISIFENMILALQNAGVSEIYAVGGHLGEILEKECKRLGVEFIFAPNYATQNSAGSLFSAIRSKKCLQKAAPSLLLNADVWLGGDFKFGLLEFLKNPQNLAQNAIFVQDFKNAKHETWGYLIKDSIESKIESGVIESNLIESQNTAQGDYFGLLGEIYKVDKKAKSGLGEVGISFLCENSWGYFCETLQKINKNDFYESAVNALFGEVDSIESNLIESGLIESNLIESKNAVRNKSCKVRAVQVRGCIEIDSFADILENSLLSPQELAEQIAIDGLAVRLGGFTNYNFKINLAQDSIESKIIESNFIESKNMAQDSIESKTIESKIIESNQNKNSTKSVVLRICGLGSEAFVDRESEVKITSLVPSEISPSTRFWSDFTKTTDFLENYYDMKDKSFNSIALRGFAEILKKLHSIKLKDHSNFLAMDLKGEIEKYEKLLNAKEADSIESKINISKEIKEQILQIADFLAKQEQVLCHRDLLGGNLLFNGENVKLIDFEYAGFDSYFWDLGNLIAENALPKAQRAEFLGYYFGELFCEELDKSVRKAQILVHYIWGLWYEVNGNSELSKQHFKELVKDFEILNK